MPGHFDINFRVINFFLAFQVFIIQSNNFDLPFETIEFICKLTLDLLCFQVFSFLLSLVLFKRFWLTAMSKGIQETFEEGNYESRLLGNEKRFLQPLDGDAVDTIRADSVNKSIIDGYSLINYSKDRFNAQPVRYLRQSQLSSPIGLFNFKEQRISPQRFFQSPTQPPLKGKKDITPKSPHIIFPAVKPPAFMKRKALIPRGKKGFPLSLIKSSKYQNLTSSAKMNSNFGDSTMSSNSSQFITIDRQKINLNNFVIKRNRIGGIILIPKIFFQHKSLVKKNSNNSKMSLVKDADKKEHIETKNVASEKTISKIDDMKTPILNRGVIKENSNKDLSPTAQKEVKDNPLPSASRETITSASFKQENVTYVNPDSNFKLHTTERRSINSNYTLNRSISKEVTQSQRSSLEKTTQSNILRESSASPKINKTTLHPSRNYMDNLMVRNLHFNVLQNYRLPNHTKSIVSAMLAQKGLSDQQKLNLYANFETQLKNSEKSEVPSTSPQLKNPTFLRSTTPAKQNEVFEQKKRMAETVRNLSDKQKLEILQKVINKQKINLYYRQLIHERIQNISKFKEFSDQSPPILQNLLNLYQKYANEERILSEQRSILLNSLQKITSPASKTLISDPIYHRLTAGFSQIAANHQKLPLEQDSSSGNRPKDLSSSVVYKRDSPPPASSESLLTPALQVASEGYKTLQERVASGARLAGNELSYLAQETTQKLMNGLHRGTSNLRDVAKDAYRGARQTQFYLEKLASESVRHWGKFVGSAVKELLERTESIVSSFGSFLYNLQANILEGLINQGEELKTLVANKAESVNSAVQRTAKVLKRVAHDSIEKLTGYNSEK